MSGLRVLYRHSLQWAVPLMTEYNAVGDVKNSGKMIVLLEILKQARLVEDKVLVFSQSVTTLNLIQSVLIQHNIKVDHVRSVELAQGTAAKPQSTKKPVSWVYLEGAKCNFLRLDGSTPQAHRLKLVDQFNAAPASEISVFLLSTKAAGEGLNIHSANRVVMYDACWNPCHDHEAMCRAYRFGQRKTTYVYRLVAAGTMERTIYDQQTKKEALIHRVIDAKATKRSVTSQDLRNFFNLKRFNRLQKKTLSKSDLDVSTDMPNDSSTEVDIQKKARERKALSRDKVLLATLEAPDGYVTEFRLENLLMHEDESEKLQGEEKRLAMELYKKQIRIEEDLIARGVAPANAASMSIQSVNIGSSSAANYQYPYASSSAVGGVSQAPTPIVDPAQIHAVVERAESPRRLAFLGMSFLVLQRRMSSEEFDFICNVINQEGGNRVVELQPKTNVIISRWSIDRLEKYVERVRNRWIEEYDLNPGFKISVVLKSPEWIYDETSVPFEKRPGIAKDAPVVPGSSQTQTISQVSPNMQSEASVVELEVSPAMAELHEIEELN